MAITITQISALRAKTGLSISLCKEALEASNGNEDGAIEFLEKKSLLSGRIKEAGTKGIIRTYEHNGSRIGVMVEISCNTDFVAKNEEFQKFATDVALQVASMNPQYVSIDDVDERLIIQRRKIFKEQLGDTLEKKPPQAVEAILSGKLKKWASEVCLLQQPFFLDESGKTIEEIQNMLSTKFGETVRIKRFVRYELA